MALSPVNTVDLFTKVTKSVVINGFDFISALEHTLKQCLTLGRHTNVVHIHPFVVLRQLWLHSGFSREPTSANMLAELSHIWL
jgi:hypothetical protein